MKILVPLPEPEARRAMFEELLPSSGDNELPYDVLVDRTEGYSGSDIRLVCKEAAMQPLRRLMALLEQKGDSLGEGMILLKSNQSSCNGWFYVLHIEISQRPRQKIISMGHKL